MPLCVPHVPGGSLQGQPFLPPGSLCPPCPGLPVTACLFASPGGGGGGGRQKKEGNLIKNALVPAGNSRQTRSPPTPCLGAGQETLGRMPRRPGAGCTSPDVWVVPHQHPDLHLDARSVLQLQDLGQVWHHLVKPVSLGFLWEQGLQGLPVQAPSAQNPFRDEPCSCLVGLPHG